MLWLVLLSEPLKLIPASLLCTSRVNRDSNTSCSGSVRICSSKRVGCRLQWIYTNRALAGNVPYSLINR